MIAGRTCGEPQKWGARDIPKFSHRSKSSVSCSVDSARLTKNRPTDVHPQDIPERMYGVAEGRRRQSSGADTCRGTAPNFVAHPQQVCLRLLPAVENHKYKNDTEDFNDRWISTSR